MMAVPPTAETDHDGEGDQSTVNAARWSCSTGKPSVCSDGTGVPGCQASPSWPTPLRVIEPSAPHVHSGLVRSSSRAFHWSTSGPSTNPSGKPAWMKSTPLATEYVYG